MSTYQTVTFFLQVAPEWDPYSAANGDLKLIGAKATRLTQKQPDPPRAGTVLVKLTLQVPSSRLLPLQPATLVLAEDDVELVEVAVGVSEE